MTSVPCNKPRWLPASRRQGSWSADDSSSFSSSSESQDSDFQSQPDSSIGSRSNKNFRSKKNNKKKGNMKRMKYFIPSQESQVVAIDCEMVGVGQYGLDSAVARVTVVDWWGGILFDRYVKQTQQVKDYRTFVSGITEDHVQNATLSLRDCRKQVLDLLYGRILVGHGLKNDLNALGISHPWWLTRDTAQYKPFMQMRHDQQLWPRKLKDLAQETLGQEIQVYGRPHSPYEDALAALNLYKTVRAQWEHKMRFKVGKTKDIENQKQQFLVQQNQMARLQYQQMIYYQQQEAHAQLHFGYEAFGIVQ